MKKAIVTLLALAFVLGFAACTPQQNPEPNPQPQPMTKEQFDALSNDSLAASQVVVSPDTKLEAVVYPMEFEEKTEVYIFNNETQQGAKVLGEQNLDAQQNIKNISFYDNDNLLLIIGSRYGTTAVGGDVYRFNLETKELKLIYQNAIATEQVLKAEAAEGGLSLTVAVFDDEMMEYTAQARFVATEDLIQ